jgi:hypothetical protein
VPGWGRVALVNIAQSQLSATYSTPRARPPAHARNVRGPRGRAGRGENDGPIDAGGDQCMAVPADSSGQAANVATRTPRAGRAIAPKPSSIRLHGWPRLSGTQTPEPPQVALSVVESWSVIRRVVSAPFSFFPPHFSAQRQRERARARNASARAVAVLTLLSILVCRFSLVVSLISLPYGQARTPVAGYPVWRFAMGQGSPHGE